MFKVVTLIISLSVAGALAQAPAAPVLAYPADGAKDFSLYGTLKWKKTAGATGYHLQVAIDLGFTDFFMDDSAVADTAVKMPRLADSVTYYWRARARNASGFGPFSKGRSFTTTPPLELGPTLSAPPDYAGDIPTTVDLAWEAFPGATSYHVQVSTANNFATIDKQDTVTGTTWKVAGLSESTEYFWHVRALGPSLPGEKTAWTKARFLTAGSLSLPGAVAASGRAFRASVVAGRVEATFHLAAASPARITVSDWTGRRVEALDLGLLGPGGHRVEILRDRPAGVYLARFEAGGVSRTARFVLP
jgi:hypothetical protein